MSNQKITQCKARLVREEFWGQVSSPPQSEWNTARDAAMERVDPLYHPTLKFSKLSVKIAGSPKNTSPPASFNLSGSGVSGTEPKESTVDISLDNCCGTIEDPPAGSNVVKVSRVKKEKLPEIRTVATPHASAKVTIEWLYSWKEADVEYVQRVYQRARSEYLREMGNPNVTPQRYNALKAGLNKLTSLWQRKDYEGVCSYCNTSLRMTSITESVHKLTEPLQIFKKTLTTEDTYKNIWKCKYAVELGYTGSCCDSSSSSSSSSSSNCACASEVLCDDLNDCESFQDCVGRPAGCFPVKGCCVDNCAELCSNDPGNEIQCSEPGATCRDNCCWEGDCRWSAWDLRPEDVPCDVTQTTSRYLLRGALETCQDDVKIIVGTKDCTSPQNSIQIDDIDPLMTAILKLK
jgi:hypothetical protein